MVSGGTQYCPALVEQGGATWGHTQQEALKNIHEVIQLVVESMMEQGEALPAEPARCAVAASAR